jgi:hypothetical protein
VPVTAGSVNEFEAQRSRMFGLAYRLLGSAEEAEDIVQDAFLRWSRADRAEIAAPRGAGTGAHADGAAAPAGSRGRHGDVRVTVAEVNGEPALLAWSGDGLLGVLVLEADGDRIRALWAVANPDKLGFAARQAARVSHPGGPASP